ncbi:MAG: valine--tRNA ligase [Phycisphaerales bacterium]|nr:valine--tRNA ligase [Phycisphaerales bacterium]
MSDPAQTPSTSHAELPKQYRPADHESHTWTRWEAARAFHANPAHVVAGLGKPYSVVIPPPNVTDRLHLGHALNNTLQDILVRAHRMRGHEALWMPGTDHAGIATQAVVEKRVWNDEKKRRHDFTREQFIARIQAFKDEYEAVITGQLKKMGCSCDWDRQRFTMDDVCARAVREAFFQLFKDGLIYRGKRLVNWDPVLQTAVADDECFDEEVDAAFYYLRYPLVHAHGQSTAGERRHGKLPPADAVPVTWSELSRRGFAESDNHPPEDPAYIVVATTRPETYLGDTAVAVNPHDPRAKALRGLCVDLPLVGRVIPIVEDEYVVLPEIYARDDEERADPKAAYATGFLKVTPAHDANDYDLYQRHKDVMDVYAGGPNAALVNVFAPDATVSDKHGWRDVGSAHLFVGKSRDDARKLVVDEFKARGLLERTRPYRHSVTFSDRSKAIIEPYLSDQWYVKVTDPRLAAAANKALATEQRSKGSGNARPAGSDGQLRFHPDRYAKTYELWHDNIRDWCISRQLWWGHRIPVWTKSAWTRQDEAAFLTMIDGPVQTGEAVYSHSDGTTHVCLRDASDESLTNLIESIGFVRDPDVLDTWFSSALWPMSTMGWPDPKAAGPAFDGLLAAFNPTSTLCTAREIITLWVSRMVMMNRYLMPDGWNASRTADPASLANHGKGHGPLPFRDVFIHCVIQDGQGQKMSKSLGNGVDPLDIISSHGADAMRFTLCNMATQTQDVRMPVDLICPHTGATFTPKMFTNKDGYVVPVPVQECPTDKSKKMVTVYGVASGEAKATPEMPLAKNTSSKFDLGRNFANKIWNAARFAASMLSSGTPPAEQVELSNLSLVDRWMISRLAAATRQIDECIAQFDFAGYSQALYDIVWRDFCDWYLEAIKPTVAADASQKLVLRAALDVLLRLAHPVMPFISETIFEHLRSTPVRSQSWLTLDEPPAELLCRAAWPRFAAGAEDTGSVQEFARVQTLATSIREVRAQHNVPPKRKIVLHAPSVGTKLAESHSPLLRALVPIESITSDGATGASVAFVFESMEWKASSLADAVDAGAERARLEKAIADKENSVRTLSARLANPGYADRAPPAMVQQTRDQLAKAVAELAANRAALASLGAS